METMLIVILISVSLTTLLNMWCFFMGARVGQKVVKGEEIELPKVEPVKAIQEFNESLKAKKEQERYRIIGENIDNYDGTGIGQQDIPR